MMKTNGGLQPVGNPAKDARTDLYVEHGLSASWTFNPVRTLYTRCSTWPPAISRLTAWRAWWPHNSALASRPSKNSWLNDTECPPGHASTGRPGAGRRMTRIRWTSCRCCGGVKRAEWPPTHPNNPSRKDSTTLNTARNGAETARPSL